MRRQSLRLFALVLLGSCFDAPTLTSTIGPEGGTIALGSDAASVTIPAGALPTAVDVTVSEVPTPPSATASVDVTPNGQAFSFTPHGLAFDQPILITLPYNAESNGDPVVLKLENEQDTTWEEVTEVSFQSGRAAVSVTSFSIYLVGQKVTRDGGTATDGAVGLPADAAPHPVDGAVVGPADRSVFPSDQAQCIPKCMNAQCGDDDGCNHPCFGPCPQGEHCGPNHQCQQGPPPDGGLFAADQSHCVPSCMNAQCGDDDGCNHPCFGPCPQGEHCGPNHQCQQGPPPDGGLFAADLSHCVPKCMNAQCGDDDGCNHPCFGPCPQGEHCGPDHQCQQGPPPDGGLFAADQSYCVPKCMNAQCGDDDGCNHPCFGPCPQGEHCGPDHQCQQGPPPDGGLFAADLSYCVPSCMNAQCGDDDGCNHPCFGPCPQGEHCGPDHQCQQGPPPDGGMTLHDGCQPDCASKTCGAPDFCGGICLTGSCPSGQQCDQGKCVP